MESVLFLISVVAVLVGSGAYIARRMRRPTVGEFEGRDRQSNPLADQICLVPSGADRVEFAREVCASFVGRTLSVCYLRERRADDAAVDEEHVLQNPVTVHVAEANAWPNERPWRIYLTVRIVDDGGNGLRSSNSQWTALGPRILDDEQMARFAAKQRSATLTVDDARQMVVDADVDGAATELKTTEIALLRFLAGMDPSLRTRRDRADRIPSIPLRVVRDMLATGRSKKEVAEQQGTTAATLASRIKLMEDAGLLP